VILLSTFVYMIQGIFSSTIDTGLTKIRKFLEYIFQNCCTSRRITNTTSHVNVKIAIL
jgi:hypothetical protein